MTWFLKNKIKSSEKKTKRLYVALLKEANNYDRLVAEFQSENSFLNPQPQQIPSILNQVALDLLNRMGVSVQQQPAVQEQTQTVVKVQDVPKETKGKKSSWTPEQRLAFGEKMKAARAEKQKTEKLED